MSTFQQSIGDAIRAARKARRWTQGELASRVTAARRAKDPSAPALSVDTVSRIENGDNFQSETLNEISSALGATFLDRVALTYLSDEDSEGMTSPVNRVREVQGVYGEDPDAAEERVDVSGYERFSIPVIAEGDASPEGVFWSDEGVKLIEAEEWMSRPNDAAVKDPRCYGVKVRGDSMEPLLEAGMRVIVSPNLPVTTKGLGYVQLRNGERLIKMVHVQPGGYTLESFNRAYAPRFVARDDVDAIHRIAYIRTLK